jgi:hypothetical protein
MCRGGARIKYASTKKESVVKEEAAISARIRQVESEHRLGAGRLNCLEVGSLPHLRWRESQALDQA